MGKASSFNRMVSPTIAGHLRVTVQAGKIKRTDPFPFFGDNMKDHFLDQQSDKIEVLANPFTASSKRNAVMGADPVTPNRYQKSV